MYLLILPNLPSPISFESIHAAYGSAISTALSKIDSEGKAEGRAGLKRLDIAICSPTAQAPRTSRFHYWQSVVALLYQVICLKAIEACVDLDIDDGVDPRIFICDSFLDMRTGRNRITRERESGLKQGPIIDLHTLATSYQSRNYSSVFSAGSEEGEKVLQKFLQVLPESAHPVIERVPGGPVINDSHPGGPGSGLITGRRQPSGITPDPDLNHSSVAVGGTFDHLHIGHKLLLFGTALALTNNRMGIQGQERHITIGITGDALLVNKKHAEAVETWSTRQSRTADFLESILIFPSSTASLPPNTTAGDTTTVLQPRIEQADDTLIPNGKYIHHIFSPPDSTGKPDSVSSPIKITYVQISDPYGPTITDPSITALVISAETRAGGDAVNKKRAEVSSGGWKSLEILEVNVLDMEEVGESAVSRSRSPAAAAGGGGGGGGAGAGGGGEAGGSEKKEKEKETKTGIEDFKNKISSTRIRSRIMERRRAEGQ